jgi:hypothetical protein
MEGGGWRVADITCIEGATLPFGCNCLCDPDP